MVSILNDLRGASGLQRLLELLGTRKFLFFGSRESDASNNLYPRVYPASTDPDRVRGFFVPSVGLLPPRALVGYVFPNPVLAAALALLQSRDGVCAVRVDDFASGSAAVFLGENAVSAGNFRELLTRIRGRAAAEPLDEYRVEVLDKSSLPRDRLDFPMPGCYVAEECVRIVESVRLTVGDARTLAKLFQRLPLISFGKAADARGDPFTGIYSEGAHLEFDKYSGELVDPRIPTEADRRSAIARAKLRGSRWLERVTGRPLYSAEPSDSKRPPASAFGRAVRFIDDHCTEALSVAQIAAAAELSVRHLQSLFQEVMGCAPLEYVAHRRLELAERLISQTALSMGAIAERCGFAEQSSLTRSFKRKHGLTPMALRKRARFEDKKLRVE